MERIINDRKSPSAAVMDVERDRPALIIEPWVTSGPGGGPHHLLDPFGSWMFRRPRA